MTNVTRLTFSVAEAAAALGVGRTGLYRLIGDGKLRVLKVGSRTLIPRDALNAFIASASTAPHAQPSASDGRAA